MIIAVIGGDPAPERALRQAEVAGREIALRGHMLICGGRGGVMEAACRGAAQAGGLTIGVLPDSDRSQMNPYVQISIVSGIGRARNLTIALTADALIAVDGGYGTLSEIAFALQHGKPLAGLGTWRIESDGPEAAPIFRTEDPLDAVEWAIEAAGDEAPPLRLRRGEPRPARQGPRRSESCEPGGEQEDSLSISRSNSILTPPLRSRRGGWGVR